MFVEYIGFYGQLWAEDETTLFEVNWFYKLDLSKKDTTVILPILLSDASSVGYWNYRLKECL